MSRDTPEPSAFSHEILNARPYAFLDDAPLEERRTQAVQTRRAGGAGSDIGALDAAAIERVRDEVRPDPRDADELHDALLTCGFMLESEVAPAWCVELASRGRATCTRPWSRERSSRRPRHAAIWVAAERLPELLAVHPDAALEPPSRHRRRAPRGRWTRGGARGAAARTCGDRRARHRRGAGRRRRGAASDVDAALLALEAEGVVLRGSFHAGIAGARVVRPAAARAHPSLHVEPAARRDLAGQPGGVHAIPVRLAARRRGEPARRERKACVR